MKTAPLFSEGSRASRIARVVLYLGWMAGTLINPLGSFLGVGHAFHRTSMIVALICLLACGLEYWRVHRTSGDEIQPLNLKGPSQ